MLVNVMRSIPFLILLILVIPLTRAIVGKSYGPSATIVPLTLAAAPLLQDLWNPPCWRWIKESLRRPRVWESRIPTIVIKVMLLEARSSLLSGLAIALGTILGYSAMAGAVGGGGLGDIAIRYGYNRYQLDIMIVTVILGGACTNHAGRLHEASRKLDKRITG